MSRRNSRCVGRCSRDLSALCDFGFYGDTRTSSEKSSHEKGRGLPGESWCPDPGLYGPPLFSPTPIVTPEIRGRRLDGDGRT